MATVTIEISDELAEKLNRVCKLKGTTTKDALDEAVDEYVRVSKILMNEKTSPEVEQKVNNFMMGLVARGQELDREEAAERAEKRKMFKVVK
jgi:predicted transcriptional regulator